MSKEVRLAFIWHMHQPDYRDPATGVHLLPWVQLHSARGYNDVAKISVTYPSFKQTINFSPVLLNQLDDLLEMPWLDYFMQLCLKPSDDISDSEKDFLLRHCFLVNWDVHVKPNQRYNQLLMKRGPELGGRDLQYTRMQFTKSDIRDLIVHFFLAWSGFHMRKDPEVIELIKRGQSFSDEEKIIIIGKHREALGAVIPLHSGLQSKGTIELTCSPFYHPILPLLVDTKVRPDHDPSTPEFRYPGDARRQLILGIDEFERVFGHRPSGMWPSEGSVSQAAVELIQETGIKWLAMDEALLFDSSTGTVVPENATNRIPWLVGKPDGPPLAAIFRDRGLSDDIGFQFSWKDPVEAVKGFLGNLEKIAKGQPDGGPPALVGIVCDGENPWEHYHDGGEGFLTGLAEALENHKFIKTTTPSEYLREFPPERRVAKLGAGSWISGNFDIWIGCDEDRRAWGILAEARKKLDEVFPLPDGSIDEIGNDKRQKVLEQLWVAEGSDWFWWYGEPFHSSIDYVFDILFRRRLRRAYEIMGLEIPAKIIIPIDPKHPIENINVQAPLDVIHPMIDGKITNFYEWSGAGHLANDQFRGLLATGSPGPLTDIFFNADTENLYLRLDFNKELVEPTDVLLIRILRPIEVNLAVDMAQNPSATMRVYRVDSSGQRVSIENIPGAAVVDIVELSIPIKSLEAGMKSIISLACFMMRGSERIDRCPLYGTISVTVPDERYLASLWRETY